MINSVVAQKLQALDRVLAELRSLAVVSVKALRADWQQKRAIERNLQVLVEVVIDVCQRLIVVAGQAPAATGADAVARCVEMGALTADENYTRMVRLRNSRPARPPAGRAGAGRGRSRGAERRQPHPAL